MINGVFYFFKKNKIDVIYGVVFLKIDYSLWVIDGENV